MNNGHGRIRTVPNPVYAYIQSIVSELAEQDKLEHPLKDEKVNEVAEKIVSLHKQGKLPAFSHLQGYTAKQSSSKSDWKLGEKIIDSFKNEIKNIEHKVEDEHVKIYDKILDSLGIRPFSVDDPGWAQVGYEHLKYVIERKPVLYRDWEIEGKNNRDYSVIQHELPDNAKIGLMADWGTGTSDSVYLLEDMVQKGVDVIIHLGDIYYAGTPYESQKIFDIIEKHAINKQTGKRIPVYMIPGNHDYYSFGYGFYPLIDELNKKLGSKYKQDASYFCLLNKNWKFLGMDTGINDYYNFLVYTSLDADKITSPEIKESELVWHMDKLKRFGGKTILLSHHQLFSGNTVVNGPKSTQKDYPFVNNRLVQAFLDYSDNISAWFWGHEHNLVIFEDDQLGYKKGRLIGCSGYEERENEYPYKHQPGAPIMNLNYKLDLNYKPEVCPNFYNHSYAVITLDGAAATADYYQVPSWAEGQTPKDIKKYSSPIHSENL